MEKYVTPQIASTSVGNISTGKLLSCKSEITPYERFWNEIKFFDFGYIHKKTWLFNGTLETRNKFLVNTGTENLVRFFFLSIIKLIISANDLTSISNLEFSLNSSCFLEIWNRV